MRKDTDSSSKNRGKVKLHYEGTYDDDEGNEEIDVEGFSWVNKADYIRFYDETAYDPCKCDEQGCLSCFLDETNGWAHGFGGSVGMLWFGKDEQGKKWNYDGDLDLVYQFNAEVTKRASVARDSDKIDVRNSGFYVGTPTFAMKRGNRVPFLMYQKRGPGVADEKSIEEIRDEFAQYLDDDSLGQGYVYKASGLTYGDMNSLMGDSDNWLDDWDGFYSFYEFNNKLSRISSEIIFNIFDNQGTLYEQTYDNGSWGVRVSPRQRIMGHDQLRPNPRGYGLDMVRKAETKRASVGMIVQDGDPSSPPSDIFMADGYALDRVDYIINTMRDLRYDIDDLVEGAKESEMGIDNGKNFYNRTAKTKQLLGEGMNQMSMLGEDNIFNAEDHPEYGPSAIDYQGPDHYEIVLRKTSTPIDGEYGFCITKALTKGLDWKAAKYPKFMAQRLFMEDDSIMYHQRENLKGRIYDDEIRDYRPMNDAEKRLYENGIDIGNGSNANFWSVRLDEYTHFQAEDPTQADASNMGGPTTPGNAGVPADVGGDDLVPYDSPSAPPAGVFMNAEYKTYESRPVRNALFGVAFAVSGLYFWSTAGSVVKNWVVVRVEKYAPKLLEPQFQTMLTLTAFFGILYFGLKLRGSSKGLTIPSMIDLPLESAVEA